MKNLNFANEALESTITYIKTLNQNDYKIFSPATEGLTNYGNNLKLGFSTYGLKIYYMLGEWERLSQEDKNNWTNYINSFQKNYDLLPKNSYVDDVLYNFYTDITLSHKSKDLAKRLLNVIPKYNYDTNQIKFKKSVNAETKQAIASLYQVGEANRKPYSPEFTDPIDIKTYLNSLDWSKPWTSGAQFASLCVFSKVNSGINDDFLIEFANSIVNSETGGYFLKKPNHSREVINGSMKILSGLDWLDCDIHYPEKLIDYCINNNPITEGCDIVDYIYVLYRCSEQTNYRKEDILNLFDDSLDEIIKLYHKQNFGFSYFKNQSQTHYYGLEITKGNNAPDLHGTLLCTWAIIMILNSASELKSHYKLIKP